MEYSRALKSVFGILGGIAGGVLGYVLFSVLVRQGLYAISLPGALVGLGCGFASRIKSTGLGSICAVASLALGLYLEWLFFPFVADDSLAYFITHLTDVNKSHLVFVAVGGLFGFWFGVGREKKPRVASS